MPEALVVEQKLPKSLSDSEVMAPQLTRSPSARGLFVEEMGVASAGERSWLILAHRPEAELSIHLGNGSEQKEAEEISERDKLVTFTVPHLPLSNPADLQLHLSCGSSQISVPYEYRKRAMSNSPSVSLENLVEFATTGDTLSLVQPFAQLIPNTDTEGNTVLHLAARNSQSYALKTLLSALPQESKHEVLNARNSRGQTALQCAIRTGDPDSVHYLMSHGADSNIADNHKNTAVHYLADAYNEAIFKEILEPASGEVTSLDALNDEGLSPLHVAVRRLKLALIEMLLDAGSPLEMADTSGRTPLIHAVIMNDPEVIQYLLQRGAVVDVEDADGLTPLLVARQNANYAVVGLLLDGGGDAKKKNQKGEALDDCDDETLQRIIRGERISLPPKEPVSLAPSDLPSSRRELFGRSRPRKGAELGAECPTRVMIRPLDGADADGNPVPAASLRRTSIDRLADEVDEFLVDMDQPSTSSSNRARPAAKATFCKDDISCLDYLTRLRLSKVLDIEARWEMLARELNCEHMVEMIGICSDADSSPSMILLDQFEQLPEAKISRVREALQRMGQEEAVSLLDGRFVY